MDRTSILIIALCFVLLGLWSFVLVPKLYPTKPLPTGRTNAAASTLVSTNQGPATSTVPPVMAEAPPRAPLPGVATPAPRATPSTLPTNGEAAAAPWPLALGAALLVAGLAWRGLRRRGA